jgi:hypothetical protein
MVWEPLEMGSFAIECHDRNVMELLKVEFAKMKRTEPEQ